MTEGEDLLNHGFQLAFRVEKIISENQDLIVHDSNHVEFVVRFAEKKPSGELIYTHVGYHECNANDMSHFK